MMRNGYQDLESNVSGRDDKSENINDIFTLKNINIPVLQNEVLAIAITQQFLMISNRKNEIIRWIFSEDESLKQAYNIPMQEKEKAVWTKFFCEPKGNHTIFKHNNNMYYFNIRSTKIKELFKLKEIKVESIGWDEKNMNEFNTNVK
jgi:hypothetical protein